MTPDDTLAKLRGIVERANVIPEHEPGCIGSSRCAGCRAYDEHYAAKRQLATLGPCVLPLWEALTQTFETARELRSYCESWEWKYGEEWDEELTAAPEALAQLAEALEALDG